MTPRTYQLHIRLSRTRTVQVGRLGRFDFAAGRYVYTGSARRGMEARIARHLRRAKRPHWHIDYLLALPEAEVTAVTRLTDGECDTHRRTAGRVIVPGFGASDCRAGCGAHLLYLGE